MSDLEDLVTTALADIAEALGLPYEVMACDPALADTAAFCEAYGYSLEESANTILVAAKSDPPRYAACVALAHTATMAGDVKSGPDKKYGGAFDVKAITGAMKGKTLCYV